MKLLSLIGTITLMLTAPAYSAVDSVEINTDNHAPSLHQGEADKVIKVKTSKGDVSITLSGASDHAPKAEHKAGYDDHAHEKKKGGLPQLNPKWYPSQIFWLAVTFLFMYIPFKFKVLPDLSSVIERRREKIEGDLIAAKNLKEESEKTQASYEEIVVSARNESSALYARAEEKIKELQQEAYSDFFEKASKKLKDAEKEVADAKIEAMDHISEVAAETAIIAAEKLVGLSVDKKAALASAKKINKQINAA